MVFKTEVPGAYLKKMDDVLRDVFLLDFLIHKLLHGFHGPHSFTLFLHKPLLFKYVYVKEICVCCILYKGLWDFVKAVADANNDKVMLLYLDVWVQAHYVIVLQHARHRLL